MPAEHVAVSQGSVDHLADDLRQGHFSKLDWVEKLIAYLNMQISCGRRPIGGERSAALVVMG